MVSIESFTNIHEIARPKTSKCSRLGSRQSMHEGGEGGKGDNFIHSFYQTGFTYTKNNGSQHQKMSHGSKGLLPSIGNAGKANVLDMVANDGDKASGAIISKPANTTLDKVFGAGFKVMNLNKFSTLAEFETPSERKPTHAINETDEDEYKESYQEIDDGDEGPMHHYSRRIIEEDDDESEIGKTPSRQSRRQRVLSQSKEPDYDYKISVKIKSNNVKEIDVDCRKISDQIRTIIHKGGNSSLSPKAESIFIDTGNHWKSGQANGVSSPLGGRTSKAEKMSNYSMKGRKESLDGRSVEYHLANQATAAKLGVTSTKFYKQKTLNGNSLSAYKQVIEPLPKRNNTTYYNQNFLSGPLGAAHHINMGHLSGYQDQSPLGMSPSSGNFITSMYKTQSFGRLGQPDHMRGIEVEKNNSSKLQDVGYVTKYRTKFLESPYQTPLVMEGPRGNGEKRITTPYSKLNQQFNGKGRR